VARARTRKGRVRQVERWLNDKFPCAYPVTVKLVPKLPLDKEEQKKAYVDEIHTGGQGECNRRGKRFHIRLSLKACSRVHEIVETLIHEWTHARVWRYETAERRRKPDSQYHDNEFWLAYGEIWRAYYDGPGYKEATRL
jgi:hypothetical protein